MDTARQDDAIRCYAALDPDRVLGAVASCGYRCDGRLLALNSYENRVYQVGIEDAAPVIAKFYRPNRWSDDAIGEEHAFARELADAEIPVVPPLADANGRTLRRHERYRFALFPRAGGRAPEPDNLDQLEIIGRFLGRLHATGASRDFDHRPTLDASTFGIDAIGFVLGSGMLPSELETPYRTLAEDLLQRIAWCYERAGAIALIRTHGDFHIGNILWTAAGPHIVDLDDARMAPAAQDLWMLISGDRAERTIALDALLTGYTDFREFPLRELHLIEALRTLRLLHYYAWLARRWSDPAFPRAFPWFNTQRAWEQHILDLREQAAAMEEAPLSFRG
ncbi:MAG: serine/threonine protein kinase [Proteobacteria bacterium]|nr:MAG: serine/threonine protein kinase [Pseudomonadota bacterium]